MKSEKGRLTLRTNPPLLTLRTSPPLLTLRTSPPLLTLRTSRPLLTLRTSPPLPPPPSSSAAMVMSWLSSVSLATIGHHPLHRLFLKRFRVGRWVFWSIISRLQRRGLFAGFVIRLRLSVSEPRKSSAETTSASQIWTVRFGGNLSSVSPRPKKK